MPLSDHEQKILEEIEKNLYQQDPAFARDVGKRSPRMDHLRRAKLGGLLFIAGFVLLVGFFVSQSVVVGVLAFGAMVGGIVMFAGSLRGMATPSASLPKPREWFARFISNFEEKLRGRYKRR